jgi:FlaG/FlaF family flagellin (archaellin)
MLKPLYLTADDKRGATPIVGNILLVGIVLILGVVLITLSLTFLEGMQPKSPDVATEATVTDGEIRIVHRAGANLDTSNLEVVVETQDEKKRVPFSQGKLTGRDTSFSAGNRWRYCQIAEPGSAVETMLVHTQSNSVLARVEQSAQETQKTGLEYRCGSAARLTGRNGGYVTFNMTNFADEAVELTGVTITSDTDATRLEGLNSSGTDHTDLYVDATGGAFTFDPNNPGPDGIAYSRPSAGPFDIGDSPKPVDLTSGPGWAFDTAVIQPDDTARFSLYQFQNSAGNPVDMRSAELTVTLAFADREDRTYSIILPQSRSG